MTLKAARVNAGFTQEEVSELVKVSTNSLSAWEKGIRYPRIDVVGILAALYGVSIDEIDFVKGDKK